MIKNSIFKSFATILDGAILSKQIIQNLALQIKSDTKECGIFEPPTLGFIINPAYESSLMYVKKKQKVCNDIGINTQAFIVQENSQIEIINKIIE